MEKKVNGMVRSDVRKRHEQRLADYAPKSVIPEMPQSVRDSLAALHGEPRSWQKGCTIFDAHQSLLIRHEARRRVRKGK